MATYQEKYSHLVCNILWIGLPSIEGTYDKQQKKKCVVLINSWPIKLNYMIQASLLSQVYEPGNNNENRQNLPYSGKQSWVLLLPKWSDLIQVVFNILFLNGWNSWIPLNLSKIHIQVDKIDNLT
jgi:hypothetical protein